MWGAALRAGLATAATGVALVGSTASVAAAATETPTRATASRHTAIWGVMLDANFAPAVDPKMLDSMHRAGIGAVVLANNVRASVRTTIMLLAQSAHLRVLGPQLGVSAKSVGTVSAARARAQRGGAALLWLSGPAGVAGLRSLQVPGRIVALTPFNPASSAATWQSALDVADANPAIDLVVWPRTPSSRLALKMYLGLLSKVSSGWKPVASAPPAAQPPAPSNPPTPTPTPTPAPAPGAGSGGSSPSDGNATGSSGSGGGSSSGTTTGASGNTSGGSTSGGSTSGGSTSGGSTSGGSTSGGSPASVGVYVSPTGDDATCVRGDRTKPCASFDKAYHLAHQGEIVEVAGGLYQEQALTYDGTKSSTNGRCNIGAYSAGDFSGPDTRGCVTFQPAANAAVTIGAHTQTTSNIDLTSSTTIPVSSTAGFYLSPGHAYYQVTLGSTGGGMFNCTGKTAASFTGCSPSISCGIPTGAWLCGWNSGTDVVEGSLYANGASFVRFMNMTVGEAAEAGPDSSGHRPADVLFTGIAAAFGYSNGSFINWEQSVLGNNNASNPTFFTNCDHCAFYRSVVENATIAGCNGTLSGQNTNYYCHGDGIYANGNTNLYIVRSKFFGNEAFHIFFDHGAGYTNPGPVTIANNMFGDCGATNGCSAAVSIRGDSNDTLTDYTIVGNSSSVGWLVGVNGGMSNVSFLRWLVSGNVGVSVPCTSPTGAAAYDVTVTYNLVAGSPCVSASAPTATNNVGPVTFAPLWATSATGDLHLVNATTVAEGAWASCGLSVDIDGDARGGSCNLGADQR